jgi:hypothetical protein
MSTTSFVPLPRERAAELSEWLRETSGSEAAGLVLDAEGRVQGVVGAETATAEHLLGDLDVHA